MGKVLQRASISVLFWLFRGMTMLAIWLDRILRPRRAFPRDPEELRGRRGWAEARLREAGVVPEDAQVTTFEVHDFKRGEAFRSRVATVEVGWRAGAAAGAHEMLAKFAPAPTSLRDQAIFVLQGNHLKEAGVYARLAADPAVPAPRSYFAAYHKPTGNLCVLMERVTHAREVREADGCPAALAPRVVDALAALHGRYWGGDEPAADFLSVVPQAIVDYFGTLFRGPDRELFGALLRQVWRHDGQPPVTVLHGDARVGNMLFPAEGVVLIDWQAARKGKGVFDLAYFLVLSVEPAVRRAHEAALLDRYHAGLRAAGVQGYSREALVDDYRNAVLLVLAFVSLPFLSAESSDTDANRAGVQELGEVWAARMMAAVEDLDMGWVGARYGLDAAALRGAFDRSHARSPG